MRKLLLLAVIAMAAVSCEKDEPIYRGDELYMYSQDFNVLGTDWVFHDNEIDEAYYYYTFNFSQLTRTVCEIGQVTATRYLDGVQSPLGETKHFDDGVYAWSETVRMDYAPGEITFIVSYSDYNRLDAKPKTMRFRVVLNW